MNDLLSLIRSWESKESLFAKTDDIMRWVEEQNQSAAVEIAKTKLTEDSFWFYNRETGIVENRNKSFFSITGIKRGDMEQPIILQNEIGFLGLLCKEFEGIMHFLIQAKIEPGNVNCVQLSPTIQATKSNFTQKHGGKKPAYLEYFIEAEKHRIIVDQLQSEQSSRFIKKRNRNIIVATDTDVEVLPSYMWATLGQIKELVKYDNYVNMDMRTVISCIPYSLSKQNDAENLAYFKNKMLYRSIFEGDEENRLPEIFNHFNNYKMLTYQPPELVPLYALGNWEICDHGIFPKGEYPFQVIYCDISIEGREVTHWTQPLFESRGKAMLGLFVCEHNGIMQFLVRAAAEIGCFDGMELGPTVQKESSDLNPANEIEELFFEKWKKKDGVLNDVVLSEEGGRFYHEQNNNVIIRIERDHIKTPFPGYFWVDYKTLNTLTQINNCLNIQLRNLISLLEC